MRSILVLVVLCFAAGLAGCSGSPMLLSVSAVTPTTFAAGVTGTMLTVTGTQFAPGMSVVLGTTALPTTLVSTTTLTAAVPATFAAGTYAVSLNVGSTTASAKTIATALSVTLNDPVPTISGAVPEEFQLGGTATTTVTGTGFVPTTMAMIDGSSRVVAVLDAAHAIVSLTADDLSVAATHTLMLRNPAPGGGSTEGLSVTVNNPVPTLFSASPNQFLTGGTATTTVTGTGFVPGTAATIDGSVRTLTMLDSTHATVALTADDLSVAGTHTLMLSNAAPGGGRTGNIPLTVMKRIGPNYGAYGDSITQGYGVLPRPPYPALLASANNLSLEPHGSSGDQACDTFTQIYASRDEYKAGNNRMYTYMIGTNDTFVKGVGAYEAVYNACDQAVLSWLALPSVNKVIAGDTAMTVTGGCSSVPDASRLGVLYCPTAGTVNATVQTFNSPLYVWVYIDDTAPASATLRVLVDGVPSTAAATQTTPLIATHTGGTRSIALLRIPVAAGLHSVTMEAPNGAAGVLGVGTVPQSRAGLSFLISGDVPFQLVSAQYASLATQQQYAADVRANVALLQSDGLDIRFAATRQTMLGKAEEMFDSLHPNALGHAHLQVAFQTGFTSPGSAATPHSMVGAALSITEAQDGGAENTLPALPIAMVRPVRAGTVYLIDPAVGEMATIGNISAHGQTAALLAPAGEAVQGEPQGYALVPGAVVTLRREASPTGAVWVVVHGATAGTLTLAEP